MQGVVRPLILIICLLLSLTCLTFESLVSNNSNNDQLDEDLEIQLSVENDYSWDILSGKWYSIQTNCITCTSTLSLNDVELDSNHTNYFGQSTESGQLRLTIENSEQEVFEISASVDIDDNYPQIRPAPSESFDLYNAFQCLETNHCIDVNSPILSSSRTDLGDDENKIISGVIDNQQAEFIGFEVTSGDTIEFYLEHSSSDVTFEAFFQNVTTEIDIGNIASSNTIMNYFDTPNVLFSNIEEDGRVIVKVSSATINTVWSLGIIIHSENQPTMLDLTETTEIFGHNTKTIIFDLNDTTAPVLTPIINDVEYTYYSLINTEWLYLGAGNFSHDTQHRIFPLPMSNAVRLTLSADVFYIQLEHESYDDINSGFEAPSLPPILISTNNSSWPLLDVNDQTLTGEFTKSIGDTSDVYRIEIDAWEDSIHFVKIEIEGDINDFEIELIEKNQEDWSEVESKVKTVSLNKLSVAMELPRGTHFFRISLLNDSVNSVWGDYHEPSKYTMITTYELVDEGEEPWFPPDENAKKWGDFARWFLGILFLIPALYIGTIQIRKKTYAKNLLSKKQRLEWLKSRLDDGISPKQNRKELAKSLEAVTTLDWDDACQTWGDTDISYRTDNVAIACWKLDERIAKSQDSWPLIIGVYIIDGNWEIAALRLDSPEGEAWGIESVTPRFLHSGYEIFLDTMNKGNKTFLSVELSGSAKSVDIELNGRMNGEPFACRASKTLYRDEEE